MKLSELVGSSQDELNLPDGVANMAELLGWLGWLGEKDEKYAIALGDGSSLQMTNNKKFVDLSSTIKDGDEIAFFPKR